MKIGLRFKFFIAITILVVGVATILSLFFINQGKRVIHDSLKQRGLTLASNLAYNAEYGVFAANKEALSKLVEGVMKQPDVAYCYLQDIEGKISVSSGIDEKFKIAPPFLIAQKTAMETRQPIIQFIHYSNGHDFYEVAVPVVTEERESSGSETEIWGDEGLSNTSSRGQTVEREIGVVRVGLSLVNANVLVQEAQRNVAFITITIILLAGLITTIVTGVAVVPIRKLVEGTRRISKGDLSFKVSVMGKDEIGELADSFNRMTDDLKRSRDELITAKDYTDNIIKSMVDILIVVDPDGRIKTINPSTVAVLGYKEEELIGESVDKIFNVDESLKGPRIQILKRLVREGFITDHEMTYRTKDGVVIPVIFSGSVLRDKNGKLEGIVGIGKDITDRKRAEEALRQSNERFYTLAANMPGMIYQFVLRRDSSVYFPYVSPGCREMFGLDPDEVLRDARLVIDTIHPDDRRGFDESVELSAQTLRPWRWEGRSVISGQIRWIQGASRPKRLYNGDILWDGILMDVTDRKKYEEEVRVANKILKENEAVLKATLADLEKAHEELKQAHLHLFQAEKLKVVGRLASGVAHEVKNPLAIILQGVEYLSQKLPKENPAIIETLGDINQAVHRADSVIRGMLDYSSLAELNIQPWDINSVLDTTLLLTKHEFTQHQVEVIKFFENKIPQIKFDKSKIEQVFVNIILNSIQAMPRGGLIKIKTYTKLAVSSDPGVGANEKYPFRIGDLLCYIEIEDTGVGIDEKIIHKIFDPFFTTKAGTGGTGLGLSIINNIIDLHNGRFFIENKKEGGVRNVVVLKVS